uniref:Uncharacterized protein n=1 Tax=viral metagenome TaxID=1070528 RepID=A0A6C0F509_9ZZZZ
MSNEEFNSKMKDHVNRCINDRYIFNIKKCCGYSEFIVEYKKSMIASLYNSVKIQFEHDGDIKLFAINPKSNARLQLPNDPDVELRQFILGNPQYFQAIYPLPTAVVYTIYFDDGCHCSAHVTNDKLCRFVNS